MKTKLLIAGAILVVVAVAVYQTIRTTKLPHVVQGFSVSIFADKLDQPGFIVFDSKNRAIVSEPKSGKVILLPDTVLVEHLRMPSGLAWYQNYLYIAENHQVSRWKYDAEHGRLIDKVGTNIANLVASDLYPLHMILFGPNYRQAPLVTGGLAKDTLNPTKLYIAAGSSCDVCVESTWKRAAVLESDPDGNFTAEYAGGLRDPTGLAVHPTTHELWVTEDSTEGLPDEINVLKAPTLDLKFGARRYGWPFCYGKQIRDTSFNPTKIDRIDIPQDCTQTEPATMELSADADPMGIVFWNGALVVALKDSVTRDGHPFLTGLHPTSLVVASDGSLLVVDSQAGAIYRVASQ